MIRYYDYIVKYVPPLTDAEINSVHRALDDWRRRGGALLTPNTMQVQRLPRRARPFGVVAAHAHRTRPHA